MTVRSMRTVSKSATFLATESVNSAPFKRGKTEVQMFWQGKAQNSSPLLRCTFFARRSAKLIANFSATMVTSLPSFTLSLSHRMYLTHNIGSASALPIISKEASSVKFYKQNSKEKLVKCATEVARLHGVSEKLYTKSAVSESSVALARLNLTF